MSDLIDFFFEAGQLKRVKRSGWWLIGVKDPETIAEHSYRTSVIGYALAVLEGADSGKVIKMCLFHDYPEARVNDLHKLGARYVDFKPAENKVFSDQIEKVPAIMKEELASLFSDYNTDGSNESIIARDADLLECAFQAKEYSDQGYDAMSWIDNIETVIKTDSAKKLLQELRNSDSNNWWNGLKKIER